MTLCPLCNGDLFVAKRSVWVNSTEYNLPAGQCRILGTLLRHLGQPVARELLGSGTKALYSQLIRQLREFLVDVHAPYDILVDWGHGYTLVRKERNVDRATKHP